MDNTPQDNPPMDFVSPPISDTPQNNPPMDNTPKDNPPMDDIPNAPQQSASTDKQSTGYRCSIVKVGPMHHMFSITNTILG